MAQAPAQALLEELRGGSALTLEAASLAGSAASLVAAGAMRAVGGVHLVVLADRDQAGYFYNDLLPFVGEESLHFFPTAYKRSVQFGGEDAEGIVRRTTVLNAVRNFAGEGLLVLCTYPEALVESVIEKEELSSSILTIHTGAKLSTTFVEEALVEHGFVRVDFVYEPGQYALRGGILDIFSFSDHQPCRVDFFGDEVDSMRHFDLTTQLSIDRLDRFEVVPNLKGRMERRTSLARYVGEATYWLDDPEHLLKRLSDIRKKVLSELEDPTTIDQRVTGRKGFLADTASQRWVVFRDNVSERVADVQLPFSTAPQPHFNKKFELLAEDIRLRADEGYTTYLLTENKAQIERLRHIFDSLGERQTHFEPLAITIHEGFIDHTARCCYYTDHQLFERYHRYRLRGEISRSEALTIQELNALKVGDYVVHIDHGVGRFGGLTRTVENGQAKELIKLVYRDNDVLLVSVHSLHRISKYKDKDSDAPKIYKLGSGAWQRLKQNTKRAVKEMAKELTTLYAQRRASEGFAFSPDSYLQHELEASFIYEDTPDQQKTTEAIKADMEAVMPMDRLVCGDVGFGKTELAVRAAFKAATDGKQVVVLVPTTILALQHYRTFSSRLKEFPVRIEQLSRLRTAAETREILQELEAGKIDILIGTHKVLGKEVKYNDLGLLIIDEEQKFGVAAKEKLRQLKTHVDTLTLTATPIPRTLQFSLMGARDLSVISTPPPNRQPVSTESHLFDEELIREAILFELGRHGQVYFVHNRIENIDQIASLITRLIPTARVAVGHGRLTATQMERLLMDFIYGEYDVLVSTTIIESGVDVPNANTIIINHAHRFGLSDLHQLRGRVGRSDRKAYCYLLSPPEESLSSDARRRLRAIEEFSDLGAGFNIAMQDLDIRGAGNLLGGEQSGFIADIGFEAYQKILAEAMIELREEENAEAATSGKIPTQRTLSGGAVGGAEERSATHESLLWGDDFLTDCQIDTDREAYIPDDYIGSGSEKLRLYRTLDATPNEEALRSFEAELIDRFGAIPPQTAELFEIVRLRWRAIRLGFEKAIVKNGILILKFIESPQSPYYQTPLFGALLQLVAAPHKGYKLRQSGHKLSVVVREIQGVAAATKCLAEMEQWVSHELGVDSAVPQK